MYTKMLKLMRCTTKYKYKKINNQHHMWTHLLQNTKIEIKSLVLNKKLVLIFIVNVHADTANLGFCIAI